MTVSSMKRKDFSGDPILSVTKTLKHKGVNYFPHSNNVRAFEI